MSDSKDETGTTDAVDHGHAVLNRVCHGPVVAKRSSAKFCQHRSVMGFNPPSLRTYFSQRMWYPKGANTLTTSACVSSIVQIATASQILPASAKLFQPSNWFSLGTLQRGKTKRILVSWRPPFANGTQRLSTYLWTLLIFSRRNFQGSATATTLHRSGYFAAYLFDAKTRSKDGSAPYCIDVPARNSVAYSRSIRTTTLASADDGQRDGTIRFSNRHVYRS